MLATDFAVNYNAYAYDLPHSLLICCVQLPVTECVCCTLPSKHPGHEEHRSGNTNLGRMASLGFRAHHSQQHKWTSRGAPIRCNPSFFLGFFLRLTLSSCTLSKEQCQILLCLHVYTTNA
jgi:hypothetical protein